jgi:hypothetical protein
VPQWQSSLRSSRATSYESPATSLLRFSRVTSHESPVTSFRSSRVTGHESQVTPIHALARSSTLLPLFFAPAPFIFNRLRTLLRKHRGWHTSSRSSPVTSHQSRLCAAFHESPVTSHQSPLGKSFRFRSYGNRPTLHYFGANKSFRFRSYRHLAYNSFRIRSYKITGGWRPLAHNSVSSSGSVSLCLCGKSAPSMWIQGDTCSSIGTLLSQRRFRFPRPECQNSLVSQTLAPLAFISKPGVCNGAAIAPLRSVVFHAAIRAAKRPLPRGCRTLFSSQDDHGA